MDGKHYIQDNIKNSVETHKPKSELNIKNSESNDNSSLQNQKLLLSMLHRVTLTVPDSGGFVLYQKSINLYNNQKLKHYAFTAATSHSKADSSNF